MAVVRVVLAERFAELFLGRVLREVADVIPPDADVLLRQAVAPVLGLFAGSDLEDRTDDRGSAQW